MNNAEINRIMTILEKAGASNELSRKAVTEFHGDTENIKAAANLWASHHGVFGSEHDIVIAYVTAVDLGWRIRNLPAALEQTEGER